MAEASNEVTLDIITGLRNLSNGMCPWKGCRCEANTLVSVLEKKKERPMFENSLLLCDEHAALCLNSHNDYVEYLKRTRNLMRGNRGMLTNNPTVLNSREDYINTVTDEVPKSSTIKCVYVGPLPLHPDWYFDIRERETKIKSMDRAVSNAIKNKDVKVTIIMRNAPRYIDKVKESVEQDKMQDLINEIKKNFDKYVFSNKYNNEVLFWDYSIYHIPIILDNACIFTNRDDPRQPISHGTLTRDSQAIAQERSMFDSLASEHTTEKADRIKLDQLMSRLL